jgi:hypothetical protein
MGPNRQMPATRQRSANRQSRQIGNRGKSALAAKSRLGDEANWLLDILVGSIIAGPPSSGPSGYWGSFTIPDSSASLGLAANGDLQTNGGLPTKGEFSVCDYGRGSTLSDFSIFRLFGFSAFPFSDFPDFLFRGFRFVGFLPSISTLTPKARKKPKG